MKWVKVFPVIVAVSSVLVIIALTPAILMDPLVTAVTQIRQNAARTATTAPMETSEMEFPVGTPVQKSKK